jgi:hypothetical protein
MSTWGRKVSAQGRLPDFLGIGVVRGGTTWLWQNLRQHPEIWLSPVKEINYFNRIFPILRGEPESGRQPDPERPNLLWEKIKDLRLKRLGRYLDNFSLAGLVWQWRFYSGRPSPAWYRSLFRSAGDRVAGDITPHYSALAEDAVRQIADFLPEIKVILLLRDPIARDWSHAVHWLTRYGRRPLAELTEQELIDHFNSRPVRLRGDYPRMLEIWRRVIPADRFFLGFLDDIHEKPENVLLRLFQFLRVEATEQRLPAGLRQRVNPAPSSPIPPPIHRYLANMHWSNLEWLASNLGGRAQAWLDAAKVVRETDPLK